MSTVQMCVLASKESQCRINGTSLGILRWYLPITPNPFSFWNSSTVCVFFLPVNPCEISQAMTNWIQCDPDSPSTSCFPLFDYGHCVAIIFYYRYWSFIANLWDTEWTKSDHWLDSFDVQFTVLSWYYIPFSINPLPRVERAGFGLLIIFWP